MNRIEMRKNKFKELFGEKEFSTIKTDPEFLDILNNYIFGEVYYHGDLDEKLRELIILVVLTTNQTLEEVKVHTDIALKMNITPVEIKEAIYQCAPYIGFPKTLNAIAQVNEVFNENNISLPIESQNRVSEETRLYEGIKVQKSIFGEVIDKMHENAPENQKHIQNYLSAFCFGDIYTRGGLDIRTRELLTLCILSALGGCESQVKSHIFGNLKVGNDKKIMIEAITQSQPYMGFPRALNALACLNELIPENK